MRECAAACASLSTSVTNSEIVTLTLTNARSTEHEGAVERVAFVSACPIGTYDARTDKRMHRNIQYRTVRLFLGVNRVGGGLMGPYTFRSRLRPPCPSPYSPTPSKQCSLMTHGQVENIKAVALVAVLVSAALWGVYWLAVY